MIRRHPLRVHITRSGLPAALMASVLLFAACGDDQAAQRIVPAGENVADMSLAELVTEWSRNIHETPLADSFLMDPAKCDMGRSTDAVFYAPTWTGGEASTTCTVRSGQAVVLVPVAMLLIEDEDGLVLDWETDWNLTSASLTVDGEVVDLEQRQVDTEVFSVNLPEGNIWETPATERDAATRAQAVVVENLSVGTHEVVLAGEFGEDEFSGTLTLTLVVEA